MSEKAHSEVECSPTERVRVMLDERGIEYDNESYPGSVFWGNASYEQIGDDYTRLIVEDATPEQAIAATVEPNKTAEWRSVALGLFGSLESADLETAKQWIAGNELLREELAYGSSESATVGGEQSDKSVRELLDKLIDDLDRLDFEADHGEMTIGEYEYARDSIVRECARNVETANRVTS